jgi:hypothetical protein
VPVQLDSLRQLPETLWKKLDEDSQRYVLLLWNRDCGKLTYKKNFLEKIGDWMLFPIVDVPHELSIQNSHIAVAVATGAATIFFLRFIAQPFIAPTLVGRTIVSLSSHSYSFAKFSITGLICRSLGRMFNTGLMTHFYQPEKQPEKKV